MARAPQRWMRRALAEFQPSVVAALLLALALAIVAIVGIEIGATSLLSLLLGLLADRDGAGVGITLHTLSYSLLVAPVVSGLLVVAAALPSRIGFRMVLLMALAAVLALGGTSCATMPLVDPSAEGTRDTTLFLVLGAVLYGPATLAALALALGAALTVPSRVRAAGVEQAEEWLIGQLSEVGWARLDDAAHVLDRTESEVRDLALHLAVARDLPLRLQIPYVVHRDATARGMAQLVSVVETQGRVLLCDLGDHVKAPVELASRWVDELAADPALPLTVDRDQDAVLWRVGGHIDMSWCPRCGGPEHRVGGGVLRCGSCDGERAPCVATSRTPSTDSTSSRAAWRPPSCGGHPGCSLVRWRWASRWSPRAAPCPGWASSPKTSPATAATTTPS